MGTKELFTKNYRVMAQMSVGDLTGSATPVESSDYIDNFLQRKARFLPPINYATASNFAKYGSAEQYSSDAIARIHNTYPYDGSLSEKIDWFNRSNFYDLYLFNHRYPRTCGYAVFSPNNDAGNGWGTLVGSKVNSFGLSSSPEYIQIKGGPHPDPDSGSLKLSKLYPEPWDGKSNVWDSTTGIGRESNLALDLDKGVTVEFWLKGTADTAIATEISSKTTNQVIFDLWNGSTAAVEGNSYGRLMVSASPTQIFARWSSGSATSVHTTDPIIASAWTDGNWHHIAVTAKQVPDGANYRLEWNDFLDGQWLSKDIGDAYGTKHEAVTGSMIANIGAARIPASLVAEAAAVNITTLINAGTNDGYGKLSGSIDEFRYWKTARTAQEISRFWFTQIAGGTNTDESKFSGSAQPVDLGAYYKFNEGNTGVDATDKVVLDYSGRISNGTWTGFVSGSSRVAGATSSAMIESGVAVTEFKDPIIYSAHPDVTALSSSLVSEGIEWDLTNNMALYHTLPEWITSEDQDIGGNTLKKLTQIIASYLDTLYLQVEAIPTIGDNQYPYEELVVHNPNEREKSKTTVRNYSNSPVPFAKNLVEGMGMHAPEIFAMANELAQLANRDEYRDFDQKLYDVKNTIYQNIYNSLVYIYKSKGTEKAFRNLVRCFGVDDELIKINLYADNTTYRLDDSNYRSTSVKSKYIDFNGADRVQATIYQTASFNSDGSATNSRSYIPGWNPTSLTAGATGSAMSFEADIIFPLKFERNHPSNLWYSYPYLTSSLFGCHAVSTTAAATNFIWAPGSTDKASFQVYALRDEEYSKDVRFMLTSSYGDGEFAGGIPTLTTSLYQDVYNNERWLFAVKVYPDSPLESSYVSGAADQPTGGNDSVSGSWTIEFQGCNPMLDQVQNYFSVTGTLKSEDATLFMNQNKRIYVGAHRQNFSGTLVQEGGVAIGYSDVKIGAVRVWDDYLPNEDFRAHAKDPTNYGRSRAYKSAYLFDQHAFKSVEGGLSAPNSTFIPQIETLLLNWDFAQVIGSSTGVVDSGPAGDSADHYRLTAWSGSFTVTSLASGSDVQWDVPARYKYHYDGRGDYFLLNDKKAVDLNFLSAVKTNLPEVMSGEDTVSILVTDDNYFTRDSVPINHYFAIEKSMYQVMSEQMLNMFSAVTEFNNVIGEPVNRYRQEYKALGKLREIFFRKVSNVPDFNKFVDFYKWIDDSLTVMMMQLIPMTANFSDGIKTMVESHILERNKYWTKFPTLEMKAEDPTGFVKGINELTYDWEHGHAIFQRYYTTSRSVEFASGSSQYIDFGDQNHWSFGDESDDSPFSISCWIKFDDLDTANMPYYVMGKNTEYRILWGTSPATAGGTGLCFALRDHTGGYYLSQCITTAAFKTLVTENTWHHLTFVYDGDASGAADLSIYVDGVLWGGLNPVGSTDGVLNVQGAQHGSYVAMHNTSNEFQVGRLGGVDSDYFDGHIDELAMFANALNAAEVALLYNDGYPVDIAAESIGTLAGYWKLGDGDDIGASGIKDSSPYGNRHGTVSGISGFSSDTLSPKPSTHIESKSCLWWAERSEASASFTAGNQVDTDRNTLRRILTSDITTNKILATGEYTDPKDYPNSGFPNAAQFNLSQKGSEYDLRTQYKGSTYALRRFSKPYRMTAHKDVQIHGGINYPVNKRRELAKNLSVVQGNSGWSSYSLTTPSYVDDLLDCDDVLNPNEKKFHSFEWDVTGDSGDESDLKGTHHAPFRLVSSSATANASLTETDIDLVNLHVDSYGDLNEVPMQGPFTQRHVGGMAHRHVDISDGTHTSFNRTENFRVDVTKNSTLRVFPGNKSSYNTLNTNFHFDRFYRDGTAKRPINIRNILTVTGSALSQSALGNYDRHLQVVSTHNDGAMFRAKLEAKLGSEGLYNTEQPLSNQHVSDTSDYQKTLAVGKTILDGSVDNFSTKAIQFNGNGSTNEFLTVADHNDFSFSDSNSGTPSTSDDFALSFWIKRDSSTGLQYVLQKSSEYTFFLYTSSDSDAEVYVALTLHGAAGDEETMRLDWKTTNGFNAQFGEWEHVVILYDGRGGTSANAGMKIYVNGVDQTSNAVLSDLILSDGYDNMSNTSSSIIIGALNTNLRGLKAKLAEMSFWQKLLTQTDVTEIYNNGAPTNLGLHSNTSYILAQWRMGDHVLDSTTTIVDASGNSHDGTCSNVASADIVDIIHRAINTDRAGLSFFMPPGNTPAPEPYLSKHKITERFSAPGGPETAGDAFGGFGLDRCANKYSVYNALTWRNLAVRTPLNAMLGTHCGKYGALPDSLLSTTEASTALTASFHKTQRNVDYDVRNGGALRAYRTNSVYFGGLNTDQFFRLDTSADTLTKQTVSVWTKPATGGADQAIYSWNAFVFLVAQTDGTLRFKVKGNAGWIYFDSPAIIDSNAWHHIVFAFDQGESQQWRTATLDYATMLPTNRFFPKMWVDGKPVTLTVSGETAWTGVNFYTGFNGGMKDICVGTSVIGGSDDPHRGYIQDISLWNDILTDEQVAALYRLPGYDSYGPGDLTRLKYVSSDEDVNKLHAWWQFNHATDINDVAPIGNNLHLDWHNGTPAVDTTAGNFLPANYYNTECIPMYDNWFIQHPIPSNEFGYAWITASAQRSVGCDLLTTASFITASDVGIYYPGLNYYYGPPAGPEDDDQFLPVDFAGLNTIVYEPITSSTNTLGYPQQDDDIPNQRGNYHSYLGRRDGEPAEIRNSSTYHASQGGKLLQGLLSHRNGPYGYPSWKQIRTGEHPIARHHKRNNIISVSDKPITRRIIRQGLAQDITEMKASTHTNFTEPALERTHKPLVVRIGSAANALPQNLTLRLSHANNLVTFANPELKNRLSSQLSNLPHQRYDDLKGMYLASQVPLAANPVKAFKSLIYQQTIYPKASKMYLAEARGRTSYAETAAVISQSANGTYRTFWRDNLADRRRDDGARNSMGYRIVADPNIADEGTQRWVLGQGVLSIWPLDTGDPTATSASWNDPVRVSNLLTTWGVHGQAGLGASSAVLPYTDEFGGTWGELQRDPNASIFASQTTAQLTTLHGSRAATITLSMGNGTNVATRPGDNDETWTISNVDGDGGEAKINFVDGLGSTTGTGPGPFLFAANGASGNILMQLDANDGYHDTVSAMMDEIRAAFFSLVSNPVNGVDLEGYTISAVGGGSNEKRTLTITADAAVLHSKDFGSAETNDSSNLLAITSTHGFLHFLRDTSFKCAPTASVCLNHFQLAGSGWYASTTYAPLYGIPGIQKLDEDGATRTGKPGADYRTNFWAGRNPWYDTYEDYADDVRSAGQEYTIVPEFKISDHMDYYIENGFTDTKNFKFLSLPGAAHTSSADAHTSSYNEPFWKEYCHSDFMKHFNLIQRDHEGTAAAGTIMLSCRAIKKLLPYNGFYPVQRTIQLAALMSSSYAPYIGGSSQATYGDSAEQPKELAERLQSLLQPFYAPGIMYNSIKSGIAVDYPIHTSSAHLARLDAIDADATPDAILEYSASGSMYCVVSPPDMRLPFEAVVNPDLYLPNSASLTRDGGVEASGRVYLTAPYYGSSSFYCTWEGTSKPHYKMAANNFVAEVPNFFLKSKTLTTFRSKPEEDFLPMASGTTYFMDVILQKSQDFEMSWHRRQGGGRSRSIQGWGFGPGYRCDPAQNDRATDSVPGSSSIYNNTDPAWAPHAPPYMYGNSVARVAFTPDEITEMEYGSTLYFNLNDILANVKLDPRSRFFNEVGSQHFHWASGAMSILDEQPTSTAAQNQMQVTSSVNIYGRTRLPAITFDATTGLPLRAVPQGEGRQAWVIHSKWETPALNFASKTGGGIHIESGSADMEFPDDWENQTYAPNQMYRPLAMWSGYGTIPSAEQGIHLGLRESFPTRIYSGQVWEADRLGVEGVSDGTASGSLLQVCGFQSEQRKIGELASSKWISEAIVAIPFVDVEGRRKFFALGNTPGQSRTVWLHALAGNDGPGRSVRHMATRMPRYVFPPHLDFQHNSAIEPFAMYIFEFEEVLSQQDLSNIWQNIMPDIAMTAKKQQRWIAHLTGENEFFRGNPIPKHTRWMVFKVKRRAATDYYKLTADSADDHQYKFSFRRGAHDIVPDYNYNWPYDFFSLVELAKIDVKIGIGDDAFPVIPDTWMKDAITGLQGNRSIAHGVLAGLAAAQGSVAASETAQNLVAQQAAKNAAVVAKAGAGPKAIAEDAGPAINEGIKLFNQLMAGLAPSQTEQGSDAPPPPSDPDAGASSQDAKAKAQQQLALGGAVVPGDSDAKLKAVAAAAAAEFD